MNPGQIEWVSQIKTANLTIDESNPHYRHEGLQNYLSYYGIDCDQMDEYRCGFVTVKGKKQFQQFFLKEKSKGTVYLIHGYLDHSTGLNRTINLLLQENFQVAVIDLPGHGFSEGEKGMISSFDDYLDAIINGFESVKKVMGEGDVVGLGHSTGAALLFHACSEKKIQLKGLLLVAPLYHPFKWTLFRTFLARFWEVFPQKTTGI
ncbi:MAG: alpha/beta hydrolase [Bacillus sp. (in: Bacteria)]|nr:alpha/beta hydrolase [Bacillus sp. (in: firmicutes)]